MRFCKYSHPNTLSSRVPNESHGSHSTIVWVQRALHHDVPAEFTGIVFTENSVDETYCNAITTWATAGPRAVSHQPLREPDFQALQALIDQKDYFEAYSLSKEMYAAYPWNTTVMSLHAEVINSYVEVLGVLANGLCGKLLEEGIAATDKCIQTKQEDGHCYSWRALLGGKWGDIQPLKKKIKNLHKMKEYAVRATELIPNDGMAQHVAGAFYYHVANLNWLELQHVPPTATFEDAAKHLERLTWRRRTLFGTRSCWEIVTGTWGRRTSRRSGTMRAVA